MNNNKFDHLNFEVWVESNHLGISRSQCVGTFYYWNECLDFKDYCLKQGVECIVRTLNPSGLNYRSELRSLDAV